VRPLWSRLRTQEFSTEPGLEGECVDSVREAEHVEECAVAIERVAALAEAQFSAEVSKLVVIVAGAEALLHRDLMWPTSIDCGLRQLSLPANHPPSTSQESV